MFLSWGIRPSHRDKTIQHTDIVGFIHFQVAKGCILTTEIKYTHREEERQISENLVGFGLPLLKLRGADHALIILRAVPKERNYLPEVPPMQLP